MINKNIDILRRDLIANWIGNACWVYVKGRKNNPVPPLIRMNPGRLAVKYKIKACISDVLKISNVRKENSLLISLLELIDNCSDKDRLEYHLNTKLLLYIEILGKELVDSYFVDAEDTWFNALEGLEKGTEMLIEKKGHYQ